MRKRLQRRLRFDYQTRLYKPQGVPARQLEISEISHEEIETLRLRYLENKTQEEAAEQMGLSQSQYQRDMWEANKKIIEAIVEGKGILLSNK